MGTFKGMGRLKDLKQNHRELHSELWRWNLSTNWQELADVSFFGWIFLLLSTRVSLPFPLKLKSTIPVKDSTSSTAVKNSLKLENSTLWWALESKSSQPWRVTGGRCLKNKVKLLPFIQRVYLRLPLEGLGLFFSIRVYSQLVHQSSSNIGLELSIWVS